MNDHAGQEPDKTYQIAGIQKIQELLGVSLDDPEERFNVQLAIKALRVTKACRNWG